MVGSGFPYSEFLPRGGPGARRADRHRRAHAEPALPDGGRPRRRRAADAARAAAAARAQDRPRLARGSRAQRRATGGTTLEGARDLPGRARSTRSASSGSSRRACPTTRILACDSGSAANWYRARPADARGMMASLSGTLATMGAAMPYAIAAKFAHPDRPVIALVGDGAMQMNGIAELITVAKYWRRWQRPAARRARAQQPRPQPGDVGAARPGGRPEVRGARRTCPDFPYARYAELLGLGGVRVDDPERVGDGAGTRRWPPTGRSCSRWSSTRTCRRCRRTSRSSRRATTSRPSRRATRTPSGSCARRSASSSPEASRSARQSTAAYRLRGFASSAGLPARQLVALRRIRRRHVEVERGKPAATVVADLVAVAVLDQQQRPRPQRDTAGR